MLPRLLPPLLLLLAGAVLLLLQPALAIFADQAGINDWTLQNIGEALSIVSSPHRFFVSTREGAIAAFSLAGEDVAKSKDFLWRRVLPDHAAHTLLLHDDVLLSITTNGMVIAWDLEGGMLWDMQCESNVRQALVLEKAAVVAVLCQDGRISGHNLRTGASVSRMDARLDANAKQSAIFSVPGQQTPASVESTMDKIVINMQGGKRETIASLDGEFALTSQAWLAYKTSNRTLALRNLLTGKEAALTQQVKQVLSTSAAQDAILVRLENGEELVLQVSSQGVVTSIPLARSTFTQFASGGGKPPVVWTTTSETSVRLFDGSNVAGREITGLAAGKLHTVWQVPKDKVVVLGADHSLALYHLSANNDGKLALLWVREEALAQVDQIVSLRVPHHSHADTAAAGSGLTLALAHLNQAVVNFVTNAVEVTTKLVESSVNFIQSGGQGTGHFDKLKQTKLVVSDERELSRFGFNRILILLTRVGKIFAIHSETHKIVWMHQQSGESASRTKLYIHGEELTVLDLATGRSIVLHTLTGKPLAETGPLLASAAVSQVAHLDHSLLLLSVKSSLEDAAVVELPRSSHQQQQGEDTRSLYVPHWSEEHKTLAGYLVSLNRAKSSAVLAWSLVFSPSTQLLALAAPPANEVISTPTRSLGDGSLLVKFVNPHLIALILGGEEKDTVKVLLVDTVSGRVLHRALHRDAQGPVHAVRFEHWLVYTFWNTRALRTELVSLCLYEKQAISKKQVNPWTALPLARNFSSFDYSTELSTFTKTFYLPGQEITKLGVTNTLRGIAAKNLLVSLGGTGQILMLDQRLIDPRRTLADPTEEEKLEGLFRYSPELPLVPTHIISYFQGAGERGANLFHVAPSLLESTCTVVASGLDLFKGRASPSGAFDLLAEDFDYVLLVTFLLFLLVGVIVLRTMERKKSLQAAWV